MTNILNDKFPNVTQIRVVVGELEVGSLLSRGQDGCLGEFSEEDQFPAVAVFLGRVNDGRARVGYSGVYWEHLLRLEGVKPATFHDLEERGIHFMTSDGFEVEGLTQEREAQAGKETQAAKEAEEAKKAKEAEEAKKAKEAEEAKKAKEAEEAKKAKEAEEASEVKSNHEKAFDLYVTGKKQAEIATELGLAESTIKGYRTKDLAAEVDWEALRTAEAGKGADPKT